MTKILTDEAAATLTNEIIDSFGKCQYQRRIFNFVQRNYKLQGVGCLALIAESLDDAHEILDNLQAGDIRLYYIPKSKIIDLDISIEFIEDYDPDDTIVILVYIKNGKYTTTQAALLAYDLDD
jgi:hypothetical protein